MINPEHTFVVIMAGGVGARFWPMSREARPKQFMDILGCGRSLIQMTYDRVLPLTATDRILVVTNERYRRDVASALPDLPAANILCEPHMRNTAPCLLYANSVIAARNAHAQIVVASADHLIEDEDGFRSVITAALGLAASAGQLVSVGIAPTRPDTGYGYIEHRALDKSSPGRSDDPRLRAITRFVEKPDRSSAEQFIASGDFAWSAGIFCWNLSDIQAAFAAHLPAMNALFSARSSDFGTAREAEAVAAIYEACESISIDFGVMEKVDSAGLVLGDFGWSDLGTWASLYQQLDRDDSANALCGVSEDELLLEDSTGNIISAPDGKTVAVRGLDNFIVVDSGDALLICPRDQEQWVKSVAVEMKSRGKA